jgi:hypothetical protein
MPREGGESPSRRRYWLVWWLWPGLMVFGRLRKADWPAVQNSLLTAWWARLGSVFVLVTLMMLLMGWEDYSSGAKAFMVLAMALGLAVLVGGQVHAARQRADWLERHRDEAMVASSPWGRLPDSRRGWRYWLVMLGWPFLLGTGAPRDEDWGALREWYSWRLAWGVLVPLSILLIFVLGGLSQYWYPVVNAVERGLASLLGLRAGEHPGLGLAAMVIVFVVPVTVVAGVVWHIRRLARHARDRAYEAGLAKRR